MEKYKILEAIGEGSFGRVFRGQCQKSGKIFALKFIPKRNKVERELQSLRRECEIQKELFHPNIVRMVDAFETEGEVVAVSEYVPIQLYSLLEKHGTLPEERVRNIACNLISAIYYLHSLRILHRDIKPQNILLTLEGEAKLCDFGFSRKMGINTYVLTSVKGTPLYMAPELIDESPYDHTADLWSLGCILFELLTGKPPFCTTSIVQLIKMVHLEPIKWPINLTDACRTFLEGLLQKEPTHRLTWPDLLNHPWVKDGVIILKSSVDPSSLTFPLSSSQQEIKEQQKRQLLKQGLSQPKMLRTFSKTGFGNSLKHIGQDVALFQHSPRPEPTLNKNEECTSTEAAAFGYIKMDCTNDTDSNQNEHFEMKTLNPINLECDKSNENTRLAANVDVRAAVGSSVRKLSTISQESGFKDEDVADITSRGMLVTESRKDSMINYFSNSVDSSRRGSRPSFPTADNFAGSQLPNINEESFGNFSMSDPAKNDSSFIGCSDKPIEKEEWERFLDKTLSEVMNESNFDIYYQPNEINMVLSPLQSSNCSLSIIDKIIILLMLPFVAEPEQPDKSKVLNVYSECKVVPNLIYSLKLVASLRTNTAKPFDYNKGEVNVLHSLISLTCYLVHSGSETFITQFCDAVCIFSIYKFLGNLVFYDFYTTITHKVIALLNHLLAHSSENGCVVEQILPSGATFCRMIERLVNHRSASVRITTCFLIGHSAKAACNFISSLSGEHALISDLINLESNADCELQKSASFAVSSLLEFTNVMTNKDD